MRWLCVAVSMLGFIMSWMTHSAGVLALGLLLGFGGAFAAVLAFAAARIEDRARPDAMMISPEELVQMRKRAEAQRAARAGVKPAVPAPRVATPPPGDDE